MSSNKCTHLSVECVPPIPHAAESIYTMSVVYHIFPLLDLVSRSFPYNLEMTTLSSAEVQMT